MAPYLQMGSLKQYATGEGSDSVRDCYGLAQSNSDNSVSEIARVRSLLKKDTLIIVRGIMCEEDAL